MAHIVEGVVRVVECEHTGDLDGAYRHINASDVIVVKERINQDAEIGYITVQGTPQAMERLALAYREDEESFARLSYQPL